MRMDPIKRNIVIAFLCFLGFILGTALTLNTFLLIFNYPSSFLSLLKTSFYLFLFIYIIFFSLLYIKPKLFSKLYYYLAILLSLYMYNVWSFLFYFVINLFIDPGPFINLLIFLTGLALTVYGYFNDRNPQIDKKVIPCEKLNRDDSITLIHLTDMHLGACYDETFVQKIITKILDYENNNNEKIDFVVITGDMIDANIRVTKEMLEPFQQIKVPIYYVSGNHEDYTWREEAFGMIENDTNLIHLSNNFLTFENKINIMGIDYDINNELIRNNLKALNDIIINENKSHLPSIFLYHSPFVLKMEELKNFGVYLFLSGHIHGGQFFPFSLMRHCFGKKRILEGLYKCEDGEEGYAYCCSGTGTQGPCTRTFIRPNIGVIKIEGTK